MITKNYFGIEICFVGQFYIDENLKVQHSTPMYSIKKFEDYVYH
jgi:hypothetical protein